MKKINLEALVIIFEFEIGCSFLLLFLSLHFFLICFELHFFILFLFLDCIVFVFSCESFFKFCFLLISFLFFSLLFFSDYEILQKEQECATKKAENFLEEYSARKDQQIENYQIRVEELQLLLKQENNDKNSEILSKNNFLKIIDSIGIDFFSSKGNFFDEKSILKWLKNLFIIPDEEKCLKSYVTQLYTVSRGQTGCLSGGGDIRGTYVISYK